MNWQSCDRNSTTRCTRIEEPDMNDDVDPRDLAEAKNLLWNSLTDEQHSMLVDMAKIVRAAREMLEGLAGGFEGRM